MGHVGSYYVKKATGFPEFYTNDNSFLNIPHTLAQAACAQHKQRESWIKNNWDKICQNGYPAYPESSNFQSVFAVHMERTWKNYIYYLARNGNFGDILDSSYYIPLKYGSPFPVYTTRYAKNWVNECEYGKPYCDNVGFEMGLLYCSRVVPEAEVVVINNNGQVYCARKGKKDSNHFWTFYAGGRGCTYSKEVLQ